MNEKRPWRLSAAIHVSKEERQYVLEDVFWVPVHGLSFSCPASHPVSEPGPEKVASSEASPSKRFGKNGMTALRPSRAIYRQKLPTDYALQPAA